MGQILWIHHSALCLPKQGLNPLCHCTDPNPDRQPYRLTLEELTGLAGGWALDMGLMRSTLHRTMTNDCDDSYQGHPPSNHSAFLVSSIPSLSLFLYLCVSPSLFLCISLDQLVNDGLVCVGSVWEVCA